MIRGNKLSCITYLIIASLIIVMLPHSSRAEYQKQDLFPEHDWTRTAIIVGASLAVGLTIYFLAQKDKTDEDNNPDTDNKEVEEGISMITDYISRSNTGRMKLPDVSIGAGMNGHGIYIGVIGSF